MTKYISLFCLLTFGLFFTACNDDSTPGTDNNDVQKGSVSCKINGDPWVGVSSSYNHIVNEDNVSGNQFIMDAKDANDTRIVFTADGDTPGTYTLDVPNNILKAGASLQFDDNGNKTIVTVDEATITITALNKTSKLVSGTFSFTSDDDKYKVTEGKFTDLMFEIK